MNFFQHDVLIVRHYSCIYAPVVSAFENNFNGFFFGSEVLFVGLHTHTIGVKPQREGRPPKTEN